MTRTGGRREVLDDLAAFGSFFAVCSHPPGAEPQPPWRPLRELTRPGGQLPARLDAVRAVLAERGGRSAGEIKPRVAASITHLGLVARLIAPSLAAAATGCWLGMPLADLWWQDVLGGPVPLSVPLPPPRATAGESPAGGQDLLNEVISPLTAQISRVVSISPRVLWGNVASAVNGSAAQVASQRPDLSGPAWAAAASLFDGLQLGRERHPPGPAFRRSSCCLIYKIAADRSQGICSDCVLR